MARMPDEYRIYIRAVPKGSQHPFVQILNVSCMPMAESARRWISEQMPLAF
jgi:hypothetical protein